MPAWRSLWCPIAIAILLRVGWIVAASHSPLPVDDVDGYLPMAARLANHQPLLEALRDDVGVVRPPLYPLLLSIAIRLALPLTWILVAQVALATCAVVAVGWLSSVTAGPRAGAAGAWIAACWPTWWSSAATTATEHLDVPLVAVALALFLTASERRDGARAAAAGLAFGIAALVRSTSLYLAPVLALVAAPRLGRRAALTIACVLLVTAPYIAVVSREAGRLVVVDNLLEWNWAYHTAGRAAAETGRARVVDVPEVIANDYWTHPVENARGAAGRMKRMLFSTMGWEYSIVEQVPRLATRAVHVASGVALALLYVFAAIGAMRIADRRAARLLVAWSLLHVVAAIVGPGIEPRHRAPFEPALMALAAGGTVILAGCRSASSRFIRISSAA